MIGTVANWIAYAAERGLVVADDAASAQALQRGSDYIQFTYVSRFSEGYDETSPNVEQAVYEAAALELSSSGFFSKTYTAKDQKVLTKVGSISWTPVASGMSSGGSASMMATPSSTKIEAMLRPYMSLYAGGVVV